MSSTQPTTNPNAELIAGLYDLRIPDRSFKSTLACPERLLVAWHRDCVGVCELLDQDGRAVFGKPQERLWEVREYRRVERWGTGARYAPSGEPILAGSES